MTVHAALLADARRFEETVWRIDPARSSVEFEVPSFWGLAKVKGHFDRYEGTLALGRAPAIELAIDASSINTDNARRDKHLRSDDFFGAEAHPRVVFVSDAAALDGERLTVTGSLHAGGLSVPLSVAALLRRVGSELELAATAEVDQRQLGMTFNGLGMVGSPARLAVRGRLVTA